MKDSKSVVGPRQRQIRTQVSLMPEAGQFHCLLVEFLAEQSGSSPRVLGLRLPSPLILAPPAKAEKGIRPPRRAPDTNGGGMNGGAGKGQEKSS